MKTCLTICLHKNLFRYTLTCKPVKIYFYMETCLELCLHENLFRYIMIKHHVLAVTLCTIPRCKMLLLMGYSK